MKGNFSRPLIIALEAAGYGFSRRAKDKNLVYKCPGRPAIVVPAAIDDPRLFHRLRALAVARPS